MPAATGRTEGETTGRGTTEALGEGTVEAAGAADGLAATDGEGASDASGGTEVAGATEGGGGATVAAGGAGMHPNTRTHTTATPHGWLRRVRLGRSAALSLVQLDQLDQGRGVFGPFIGVSKTNHAWKPQCVASRVIG